MFYTARMPTLRTLSTVDLSGKRVLLRAGFDVKIENGKVMETERIEALLPTMLHILQNAALIILSHQGRPKGKPVEEFSQKPIVAELSRLLAKDVKFAPSCVGPETEALAASLQPGEVLLLENLRYEPGEEANDPAFAKQLAALGDIYVNDAFTNCHRTHASMVALPGLLPAYAGLQLEREITHLSKAIEHPARPLVLVVSGAKMETKVPVIEHFLSMGNDILVGGCIANTFLVAQGHPVGGSKYEQEYVELAKAMLAQSGQPGKATIHVPIDVHVATNPDAQCEQAELTSDSLNGKAIFDMGSETMTHFSDVIAGAGTIIWNGPLGFYEKQPFAEGTMRLAKAIADATTKGAVSLIGGGDTIDAHVRYNIPMNAYTFVSTGGGAMLEFIAGKPLPAIVPLYQS